MPEKISAGGLFDSLKKTFGFGPQHPTEAPVALETPAAPSPAPVLEPAPAMAAPGPAATEAPPAQEPAPAAVIPASSEFPDWLSASADTEPILAPEPAAPPVMEVSVVETPAVAVEAPMPALEAPSALSVAEAPVVEAPIPAAAVEAKIEADPFSVNREFNGYMRTIRQAQAVLASGIALTPEEQKKALIAVARSNSLLPKLPPEVLESVLLMRAVAAVNPKFGRDDFQLEMLAAVDVIKTGTAVKG